MSELMANLTGGTPAQRSAAAASLIAAQEFSDSISDGKIPVRVEAVQALGDLGNAAAVTHLLAMLHDVDRPVSRAAIQQLKRIGAANQANLTALMAGLSDSSLDTGRGTIQVLTDANGGIGPRTNPDVVAALVQTLVSTADARSSVGDVLGSPLFDPSANSRSLAGLLPLLNNSDVTIQEGAANALGKIADPDAAPPLIALMHSKTAAIGAREAAIGALALIASPACQPSLIEALQDRSNSPSVRAQAAGGLGTLATPAAVSALIATLNDEDLSVRLAVTTSLARAGRPGEHAAPNKTAVQQIIAALPSASQTTKLGLATALSDIHSRLADSALIATLSNPASSEELQTTCATALGFQGNKEAVQPLVKALTAKSGAVNKAAQAALASIGPDATPTLVSLLSKGGTLAYYAANALGEQTLGPNSDSVLTALKAAANSPDTRVERWAAVAIGQSSRASALPILQQLAQSTNPDVRYVAGQELEQLPGSTQ